MARPESRVASRRTPACDRSGLMVCATFSPPLTAAPTAVSATRWAPQLSDFSRLDSARARVSAALRAERLRCAAFRLRVAAAFWAAALRCVSVCVAIVDRPLWGCLHLRLRFAYPRVRRENSIWSHEDGSLTPTVGGPADRLRRCLTANGGDASSSVVAVVVASPPSPPPAWVAAAPASRAAPGVAVPAPRHWWRSSTRRAPRAR